MALLLLWNKSLAFHPYQIIMFQMIIFDVGKCSIIEISMSIKIFVHLFFNIYKSLTFFIRKSNCYFSLWPFPFSWWVALQNTNRSLRLRLQLQQGMAGQGKAMREGRKAGWLRQNFRFYFKKDRSKLFFLCLKCWNFFFLLRNSLKVCTYVYSTYHFNHSKWFCSLISTKLN